MCGRLIASVAVTANAHSWLAHLPARALVLASKSMAKATEKREGVAIAIFSFGLLPSGQDWASLCREEEQVVPSPPAPR